MSTTYLPTGSISFETLKGILPSGVQLKASPDTNKNSLCLTDGVNYLWAYRDSEDNAWFERSGANDVSGIIEVLEKHFSERIEEAGGSKVAEADKVIAIVTHSLFSCFELSSPQREAFDRALKEAGVRNTTSLLAWLERKLPDEFGYGISTYIEHWLRVPKETMDLLYP